MLIRLHHKQVYYYHSCTTKLLNSFFLNLTVSSEQPDAMKSQAVEETEVKGEGEAGGETCDSREGQKEVEKDSDSIPQSSAPDTSK